MGFYLSLFVQACCIFLEWSFNTDYVICCRNTTLITNDCLMLHSTKSHIEQTWYDGAKKNVPKTTDISVG